jgi:hypothetical protein
MNCTMSLNIKNEEGERLVRGLATETGESVTHADNAISRNWSSVVIDDALALVARSDSPALSRNPRGLNDHRISLRAAKGDASAPFKVGDKGGAQLRIARLSGAIGRIAHEGS